MADSSLWYEGALGWNTLMSENAPCAAVQKPSALMSTRAPSSELAVCRSNDSPLSSCKLGSMYIGIGAHLPEQDS